MLTLPPVTNYNFGPISPNILNLLPTNPWGGINTSGTALGTPSASSGAPANETFSQYQERIRKENEKILGLTREYNKQNTEIQNQIKELEKSEKALKSGKKQKDGSVEVKPEDVDLKKVSFLDKVTTGATGLMKGMTKVMKNLAGFDENGWNWKKCLRNVALGVGVGALCVFAAPLGAAVAASLGSGAVAGALGTLVASAPTALAYAGVATGAVMAGKGIKNAVDAKTTKELDESFQDIGAGVFVGGASMMGLKSSGSAYAAANAANGAKSGFLRNTFVNPWKASYANYTTASRAMQLAGGGMKGFKVSCAKTLRQPAEIAKNNFENTKQKLTADLQQKITDVESRISSSTDAGQKALLQAEKSSLEQNLTALNNAKTKADWKSLTKSSKENLKELKEHQTDLKGKWYQRLFRRDSSVEINGQTFTSAQKSAIKQLSDITKQQKSILEQMTSLKKARFNSMLKMSKHKNGFNNELNEFGFKAGSKHYLTNLYQTKVSTFQRPGVMQTIGTAGLVLDPAWIAQPLVGKTVATPFHIAEAVKPSYEVDKTFITAEEYESQLAELTNQKTELQNQKVQLEKQFNSLIA